jgi:hypothetical protein
MDIFVMILLIIYVILFLLSFLVYRELKHGWLGVGRVGKKRLP